ncbi:NERD domain-containing protein, partial [Bacillus thuringiensis]|nr:NERD domain-containing protein [Bacillus thuringiensis]
MLTNLNKTLLSNITLPLNTSQTTQINHIFINTKKIFIIKKKHYSK